MEGLASQHSATQAGTRSLVLRLGFLYAVLFLIIGCYLPYVPVWLKWRAFTADEIAILLATPLFGRILVAPTMTFVADRLGNRRVVLIVLAWASLASYAALWVAGGFWQMLLAMVFVALASTTLMPLTETIATSLTSLGTGAPTGQHGMVGFTQRVPETGALLNSLFWDQPVDPTQWQSAPTVFEQVRSQGGLATVISKTEFAESGLTRAALRGATYVGTGNVDDRLQAAVAAANEGPSLTYVYDGDLDATGHRFGVDSDAWRAQLQAVDEDVQELRAALPDSVGLVVTADHGMVDSTTQSRIDIDEIPGLREGVVLLGGEARFRHLYCAPSDAVVVRDRWQERLGDQVTALTRQEAVAQGWFGEVRADVSPRIGDVVVAAHDQVGLFSSRDFAYEMTLVGLHGSLTPREMEIPILQVH